MGVKLLEKQNGQSEMKTADLEMREKMQDLMIK